MKRISIYCLLIFCVLLTASAQQTKQLVILHTSDTHSRIEPIDPHAADQYAGMGGVVRRATFLKDFRAGNPDVLLLTAVTFRKVRRITTFSKVRWKSR